ncbi:MULTISPECIES: sensor histidine kinase [unclassified Nocardia]|uniref:sensor histidine kinase n=1 Tax=unclassified Nocardia TaxID=2637762 RepID=UPI00272E6538|nr:MULTISPECIES: histidine kinase [unclassified Nocardia]
MFDRANVPQPTILVRLVRLAGLVAVFAWLRGYDLDRLGVAVLVLAGIGALAYLIWALLPADRLLIDHAALLVMTVCGGLTVAWFGGSAILVWVAVFVAIALQQHSLPFGIAVTVLAAVTMSCSALLRHAPLGVIVGLLGGVALVSLLGSGRRQFRVTAEQNRLLVEQSREIRAERDRAAALAERGRIAREVHDVLAHTLGGLVLQLDAADALLEAGEVDRAGALVRTSRGLAASGLADARRVVGALRAESIDLPTELGRVAEEHRAVGGRVDLHIDGPVEQLGEQVSLALLRGAQEALTNARKHAPGAAVTLHLVAGPESVELTAENPLGARAGLLAASGMGAGLLGMRERVGALGGTAEAGKVGELWTVRITVPRR